MTLVRSNSWIIVIVRAIDQKNIASVFIQNDPRQCLHNLEFSLDPDRSRDSTDFQPCLILKADLRLIYKHSNTMHSFKGGGVNMSRFVSEKRACGFM